MSICFTKDKIFTRSTLNIPVSHTLKTIKVCVQQFNRTMFFVCFLYLYSSTKAQRQLVPVPSNTWRTQVTLKPIRLSTLLPIVAFGQFNFQGAHKILCFSNWCLWWESFVPTGLNRQAFHFVLQCFLGY